MPSALSSRSTAQCELCQRELVSSSPSKAPAADASPAHLAHAESRLVGRLHIGSEGPPVSMCVCRPCEKRIEDWRRATEVVARRRAAIRSTVGQLGVQLCVHMETVRILVASAEAATARLVLSDPTDFTAQEGAVHQAHQELETALIGLHRTVGRLAVVDAAAAASPEPSGRAEAHLRSQMLLAATHLLQAGTIRHKALKKQALSERQAEAAEGERRQRVVDAVGRVLTEAEEAMQQGSAQQQAQAPPSEGAPSAEAEVQPPAEPVATTLWA